MEVLYNISKCFEWKYYTTIYSTRSTPNVDCIILVNDFNEVLYNISKCFEWKYCVILVNDFNGSTILVNVCVLFLRRGMPTWECQAVPYCSLLNHAHVAIVSFLVFFVFICFAISVSQHKHPEKTRPVSKHTRNTPSLFDFSNCKTYTVLNAYSSFSPASFRSKSPSSQPVALCLFFVRGLNDACAGGRLVDLCF